MTSLTDRLTAKRTVLVVVLLAAAVVLVTGSREWVSGSVDDVVLGASALHGTGSDVAPGALAAALVGMAAAVAVVTTGSVMRMVAACSMLLAAVLGATAVIMVLIDPDAALGRLAAAGTGRSGTLAAHGHVSGWAWAALAAMLAMASGGLTALVSGRHWRRLSSRYEAGVPEAGNASAWDRLSRGEDPTAEG